MIFARGMGGPEGPVLLPDGSWLVVEMAPHRGFVTRISADGSRVEPLAHTGCPIGLARDRDGTIWVAEAHPHPALLKMSPDGQWEAFATECDGKPFLLPNDLCFGPDGLLYLTDSGILVPDWAPQGALAANFADLPFDGRVYRIDTRTGAVELIDAGLKFTNGIAFGLDGYLYANEMITGAVYRYRVDSATVGPRETFGNVLDPALPRGLAEQGLRGPDGMKFGADGRLYVAVYGQQDVTVLGRDGSVVERMRTEGVLPSNVAFGPAGSNQLYVTEGEHGNVELLAVETDGAPLYE